MTRRKTPKPPEPTEDDLAAADAHSDLDFHASYVVDHVLPSLAEHHGLCLGCFGREVIRQIEEALDVVEAHEAHQHDSDMGEPQGNA
jgi:hypothetical protein